MSRYIDADKIEGWFESLSFGEIIMKSDFDNNPTADVIPVPKGATNGDMIKAITGEDFSRGASIYNHDLMICEGEYYLAFNVDWWNAPYKKGVEE